MADSLSAFDRARAIFLEQHARGRFPGGQLVVRHRGVLVLDVAIGVARGFRPSENEAPVPVTPATRFCLFSASKPVVAVAIARLEEAGVLDVEAPVAQHWPEFAANGKGEITILDVLTHRCGVFTPELVRRPQDWGDWDKVRAALVAATPRFPRGTLAYLPYEFGWILAEVIQRATGKPMDSFGLRFGATRDELPSLAKTYWVGTKPIHVAGNELSQTFEHDNNLPEALTAFVPAAGLVCTAGDLAAFYDRIPSLISEATLRKYTTTGWAFDRSNRLPLRMARGFLVGSATPSIFGWWGTSRAFGHAGAFCTLGWSDPTLGLSAAIVTNGNAGPYDSLYRFAPLGSAMRSAAR